MRACSKSTNLLMTLLLSDADLFVNDELLLEYKRLIDHSGTATEVIIIEIPIE